MLLLSTAWSQSITVTGGDLVTLNGSANRQAAVVEVAPAQSQATGSAWSSMRTWTDGHLFRAHWHAAHWGGDNAGGGSGMVFALQSAGSTQLGGVGSGLGYSGITQSVGIESDHIDSLGADLNGNHLSVLTNGSVNGASQTDPGFDLNGSAAGYDVWVDYERTPTARILVYVAQGTTKPTTALFSRTINVDTNLGTNLWVGFTAACGAGPPISDDINYHRVSNFEFYADVDSDNDNVMDFEDVCPSQDDRIDLNGDQIPDCAATDLDHDGVDAPADCDDLDSTVFPGAPIVVGDGKDNDCSQNGVGDECYRNQDQDPEPSGTLVDALDGVCDLAQGEATFAGNDCDDNDSTRYPGNPEQCDAIDHDCDGQILNGITEPSWWPDSDADGYGDLFRPPTQACVQPASTAGSSTDCADGDPNVHPGAAESCNNLDDDCDESVDEGLPLLSYYVDQDADGVGTGQVASACARPSGTAPVGGDCDDTDPHLYPGAEEVCDGADNDCDPSVDEGLPTVPWYEDLDADGFGGAFLTDDCLGPAGAVGNGSDCDDGPTGFAVNPLATEVCDQLDNDCDALVDDADDDVIASSSWFYDNDADGFGDVFDPGERRCEAAVGQVASADDCDDGDPNIHPGAAEVCPDGIDNDCDLLVDDADPDYSAVAIAYWLDADGDGYGDPLDEVESCGGASTPAGYVPASLGADCDDADPERSPGRIELCDGIDNDCDLAVDQGLPLVEYCPDDDQDSYGADQGCVFACDAAFVPFEPAAMPGDCDDGNPAVNPAAHEVCNQLDDDCSGVVDDVPAALLGTWYADRDGDGLGDPGTAIQACPLADHVQNGDDCDDTDALRGAVCAVEGVPVVDTGCQCSVGARWSFGSLWFARRR